MATNPWVNNYNANNEQDLIESLVIESIQMKGLDVKYIRRSQDNIDYLFNEDPSQYYAISKTIEMYPAFVDGFDGAELMTVFGNEFSKTGTFILSKKRFLEEFPDVIRPNEGDLIFMPITNAVLEIKYVEHESPFFEKGKKYVWELKVEAFEFSHEEIYSGEDDIDEKLKAMIMENPEENTGKGSINQELEDSAEESIVFDPNNPFSVR